MLALLWAASDDAQAAAGTRPGRTATTGASAPAVPAVTAPPASEPPSDHRNLEAWLAYQGQLGITHLPDQARLFYRRGLIAWQSGQDAEALRLVRGAAQLDPSFLEPQLALAAWFVTREPSQALLRAATVLEQGREQFLLQIQWIANASFVTFHALFFGVLAAGWLVILLHQGELRHACQERLSRFLSPGTSRSWAWVLLLLPLVAGFGIALPAILLMGLLWPVLRGRERVLYVMLVAVVATAPLAGALIGGFAVPLRAGAAPLFGAPALENEPYTPALQERQTQLAEQHADNPFVQFGLGWTARRGGDLAAAEAAYRRTLTHWPNDDRLLNNLGTVLAAQGRLDEALVFCHRASDANPNNAAAFFNAAQIHTGRFDYHAANEALARASALNFELVKNYQGQSARDGSLPLVDQWIAPAVSWKALLDSGIDLTTRPALPPTWIARYEASGLAIGLAALLLGLLSAAIGSWWQRSLPLRNCSNCGDPVCRRCSERQREVALCPACARAAARAQNPEFGRILLHQHRRRVERRQRLVRTALATLLPGYGLLALRRVFGPLALLVSAAALVVHALGLGAPFAFEPRLGFMETKPSNVLAVLPWVAIFAFSLMGYFSRLARAPVLDTSPVRSRVAPISRMTAKAA